MKLITRDTGYAIAAIIFIAKQKKDIVSVGELVKCLGVPRPFLRKILQVLNKKGLLKSYKGQGGGFKLNKKLNDIYLLNLMKIFQGPFQLNDCVIKKRICPKVKTCKLKKKIDKIEKHVTSELKGSSLASLLKE